MNDLEACIGLEGIESFSHIFNQRKIKLKFLLRALRDLHEYFYFYDEQQNEIVSPHALAFVFREQVKAKADHLKNYLVENGVQVKTLFGSLPTQHRVFKFLGYQLGQFPEAEYIGTRGLHVGCHQYLTQKDLDYLSELMHNYVKKFI